MCRVPAAAVGSKAPSSLRADAAGSRCPEYAPLIRSQIGRQMGTSTSNWAPAPRWGSRGESDRPANGVRSEANMGERVSRTRSLWPHRGSCLFAYVRVPSGGAPPCLGFMNGALLGSRSGGSRGSGGAACVVDTLNATARPNRRAAITRGRDTHPVIPQVRRPTGDASFAPPRWTQASGLGMQAQS